MVEAQDIGLSVSHMIPGTSPWPACKSPCRSLAVVTYPECHKCLPHPLGLGADRGTGNEYAEAMLCQERIGLRKGALSRSAGPW